MIPERYLEYLALDSILQGYMECSCLNDYSTVDEVYIPWGKNIKIDVNKLKRRVRELQLEFLKEYICTDSDSKE